MTYDLKILLKYTPGHHISSSSFSGTRTIVVRFCRIDSGLPGFPKRALRASDISLLITYIVKSSKLIKSEAKKSAPSPTAPVGTRDRSPLLERSIPRAPGARGRRGRGAVRKPGRGLDLGAWRFIRRLEQLWGPRWASPRRGRDLARGGAGRGTEIVRAASSTAVFGPGEVCGHVRSRPVRKTLATSQVLRAVVDSNTLPALAVRYASQDVSNRLKQAQELLV